MLSLIVNALIRRPAFLIPALIVGAAVVATLAASWYAPGAAPAGLRARYYDNAAWNGAPLLETIDPTIDVGTLGRHPELGSTTELSAEWEGSLVVHRSALYRLALKSDGGSWLWMGNRLLIDNHGPHDVRSLTADVLLERGVHPVRVRYTTRGAKRFVQIGQVNSIGQFDDAGPFVRVAASYVEVQLRALWPLALALLWCAAFAAVAFLALYALCRYAPFDRLAAAVADRAFLMAAAVGIAASAAHLTYGLPGHQSWSPDELEPISILTSGSTGFANWNLRWPPMHLYALHMLLAPFAWASRTFGLPLGDAMVVSAMYVVTRGVGLAMLAAALLLTFDIARRVADRRTGVFAVLLLALAPVVVHFGPLTHLEIAHLFWMAASLWAWVALDARPSLFAFALFGATVGFSLATKDQAYGFYLAAPFACVWLARRPRVAGETLRPWLEVLRDSKLAVLALSTLAAFALGHGLPANIGRFVAHLRFMLSPKVTAFQMFPATIGGEIELAGATVVAFVWAAGVPLAAAFVAGCVVLWRSPERRLLMWLVPVGTYCVLFLGVILYVYDRFLVGALPVVAIIGGFGLRGVLDCRRLPTLVRFGIPGLVVGIALAGAIAQNIAFHDDPRGRAARWLSAHVPCGSSVGLIYNREYAPALDCYRVSSFIASQSEDIVRWPEYLVLNDLYRERFRMTPSGRRFLERLESGALGFEHVFRAAARPALWAPLFWEARFRNNSEDPATTLDKPLNAIDVWKK